MIGIILALSGLHSDIQIIDSKANNSITYVIVDDCIVSIEKKKLKDVDAVVKQVNLECGLDLDEL